MNNNEQFPKPGDPKYLRSLPNQSLVTALGDLQDNQTKTGNRVQRTFGPGADKYKKNQGNLNANAGQGIKEVRGELTRRLMPACVTIGVALCGLGGCAAFLLTR